MQGIRALLLDIDGTVLDTREFIFQAAEHALAAFGYTDIPRIQIAPAMGHAFDDFFSVILKRRDFDPLPMQTAYRMFQLEHMDLSKPFPNTKKTLEELRRRGYMLAAVSSRARASLIPTLNAAELTGLFNIIVTPDDAPELKPSPVPLELAMSHMRVAKDETAMVGDHDFDIEAGKRAGVATIRARYAHIDASLDNNPADAYLDHDIDELLEMFPVLGERSPALQE